MGCDIVQRLDEILGQEERFERSDHNRHAGILCSRSLKEGQ